MGFSQVKKIPVTCNRDCGGACPLLAWVENGRVTRITANPLGGRALAPCLRGLKMIETLYSPQRLKKPLLRTGPRGSGRFKEIDWDQALDLAAERLKRVREEEGNQAVLALGGSGSCRGAFHHTGLLLRRFLAFYGGYTATYGSYSSGAAQFTYPYVLGGVPAGVDPATLLQSRLIILWGANVSDCRLGTETAARIRQARRQGTEVVVIDPRRTRTVAEFKAQWIPVLPGTDSALMMAVLHALIEKGLVDREFVARYSAGFERLEAHVLGLDDGEPKTPAWAEKVCSIPARTIIDLALRYGRAKPAALLPGLSFQRALGGEEAVRMAISLQVATGNLGRPGGTAGTVSWHGLPGLKTGTLPLPANPLAARVPVYLWPDAVLEGVSGGYPSEIKLIYNVGGNYLAQGADVRKNIRAFEKVGFSICHELFLTPTARHCDLVLPAVTALEREDIVLTGGSPYLLYSNRAVEPLGQARTDYHILSLLADRLGFGSEFHQGRTEGDWLASFGTASEVADWEEFKRTGIFFGPDRARVGLAGFIADPISRPLPTPSGRVELAPESWARTGFPAVPSFRPQEPRTGYPLRLVTPKSRYRIHSQNFNLAWSGRYEAQDLTINPLDAGPRGIKSGQEVVVASERGRVRVRARLSEEVMPGVVCLLEGAWPAFDREGIDRAGAANVLTSTEPTRPSLSSRTHSVLVEVTGIGPNPDIP